MTTQENPQNANEKLRKKLPGMVNEEVNSSKELQENITNPDIREQGAIEYKEISYRWFILVAYCLVAFSNGFQWITFTATSDKFSTEYSFESWRIVMLEIIYMIIFPVLSVPESWFVDKYSIGLGIIACSATTIGGGALKMLINKDKTFASLYIGQVLNALFRPAVANSAGKIAAVWFRPAIRNIICTVCCLSDTLGIFIGFVWRRAFVKNEAVADEYRQSVFYYTLSEFILTLVFCFPAFFINKDIPTPPPSPSQNALASRRPGLADSLKKMFCNKEFIFLLIAAFFMIACYYYFVMGTIAFNLLTPYQVENPLIVYVVANVIAIVAAVLVSIFIGKKENYKLYLIIICGFGVLCQLLNTFLPEIKGLNNYAIFIVLNSFAFASTVCFYCVSMNFACEICYPVGESLIGAFLLGIPHLLGIGGTYFLRSLIIKKTDKLWISNMIILIFMAVALVLCIFIKNNLARKTYEKENAAPEKLDNGNQQPQGNNNEIIQVKSSNDNLNSNQGEVKPQ